MACHAAGHGIDELLGVRVDGSTDELLELGFPEEHALSVHCLGDAVRVEQQLVSRLEVEAMGAVRHAVEEPERDARAPALPGPNTIMADERGIVPCVDELDVARLVVEHADPCGHEHARVVALADLAVGARDSFSKIPHIGEVGLDLGFRLHHEEGGGNPLARDIGNDEAELGRAGFLDIVLADKEEVVEVASDLTCGIHACKDVERGDVGVGWEGAGKSRFLDRFCERELRVEA